MEIRSVASSISRLAATRVRGLVRLPDHDDQCRQGPRDCQQSCLHLPAGLLTGGLKQAGQQVGYPAPPLQLTDELNLKLMQKVRAETEKAETGTGKLATEHAAYPVIDTLVEAGRPGRLDKAGFYDYDEDGKRIALWEGLRDTFKTSTELPVPFQDLIDRMLFIEAIETQRCFDEGVLTAPADANIGSIFGIGYPAWTGGVHQFIVGYPNGGQSAFVARAEELAAKYGQRFTPPASLKS